MDDIERDINELVAAEEAVLELIAKLVGKGHRPEGVAAVLAKTTYAMYKTLLPASDYEQMSAYLYEASPSVSSFTEIVSAHTRQLN